MQGFPPVDDGDWCGSWEDMTWFKAGTKPTVEADPVPQHAAREKAGKTLVEVFAAEKTKKK